MDVRDVRAGDVPVLCVTVLIGWVEKYYEHCYAAHAGGLVLVRSYFDAPNALPRAVFPEAQVFVEHFGPHPHPSRKSTLAPQAEPRPAEDPRSLAQQLADYVPEPKKRSADEILAGLQQRPSAEQQSQKYLESSAGEPDPKAPSTEETSSSDPKMLETPSGRFRTSLPIDDPKQNGHALLSSFTLGPDMNTPPQPDALENRAARRKKHGSHGRPRPLPGATALVALALFLSVCFHRTS